MHGAHDRERVRHRCITIEIEASLAFGTGHHGTTRGCLLALDRIAKNHMPRRPRHILDVGTGSGVLAIAAAKAFRRPVLASDIDTRSVRIARDNVRLNGAGAFVKVVHAAGLDRFRQQPRLALILANILLEPLQRLATPMARLASPGAHIVLSGLLTAQAQPALASYRARGLVLVSRIVLGGWTTLVLTRPSRGSILPGKATPIACALPLDRYHPPLEGEGRRAIARRGGVKQLVPSLLQRRHPHPTAAQPRVRKLRKLACGGRPPPSRGR